MNSSSNLQGLNVSDLETHDTRLDPVMADTSKDMNLNWVCTTASLLREVHINCILTARLVIRVRNQTTYLPLFLGGFYFALE